MSREYSLYTNLVEVEKGNREDLLKALESLCDFDLDFDGTNGVEYAWEETLEAEFESNLEYTLDTVKDIEDDVACVEKFVSMWMDGDSYYHEHELNTLADENGKVYVISLSAMAGY